MHGIKKVKNMKTIEKRIYYQWWNIQKDGTFEYNLCCRGVCLKHKTICTVYIYICVSL